MPDLKDTHYEILNALYERHRLTAELIRESTSFTQANRCREALKLLADHKFVTRVSWHDLYEQAGRAEYVYALTQKGMNELATSWNIPSKRIQRPKGSGFHIAHLLRMNRFIIFSRD